MPIVQIPPYAPDVSDYEGQSTKTLENVVPRADGYGPFPSFSAYSASLDGGNDTYTKVLLHFEGTDGGTTITDSALGGGAHVWTARGNANTDDAQEKFGSTSLACDGTGDWVDVDTTLDAADYQLGSGDFTIECWVKVATDGTDLYFAGQADVAGGSNANTAWLLARLGASNADKVRFQITYGTTDVVLDSTTALNAAAGWVHIAAVRTVNTLKLFINGTQEDSAAFSDTVNNSTALLGVGSAGDFTTGPMNGWIDEFRLSVGVARYIENFTPRTFAYYGDLTPTCRGFFYARKSDGTVQIFAGTSTRLYTMSNTDFSWSDVSKNGAAYTALSSSSQWQFAQFGSYVFAVHAGVAPQVYTLASSTAFSDLGGSPPQASYIAVVGRFLVLSGLNSTPYRIQWSGLNATTTWTAGTNSSDVQDLPDGGVVRGVAGGEYGLIMQDAAVRRMIFVGGSLVFQIERISEEKGIYAPLSIIRAGERVFWCGSDGFKMYSPGSQPVAIGKERVDRTFFADVDSSNLQLCIGASDPKTSRVYWAYKSRSGATGLFDKILAYDWVLDKWSPITVSGEYISSLARPGITLDALDAIYSSIDDMDVSFDDFSTVAFAELAAFNSDHKIGFFTGANLEATLVTAEKGGDGRRLRVRGFRPVTDAATVYGSLSARETASATASDSDEVLVNSSGNIPANVSTRYARMNMRIPAQTWTYVTGGEPKFKLEGQR
jgi:hypothetical protein